MLSLGLCGLGCRVLRRHEIAPGVQVPNGRDYNTVVAIGILQANGRHGLKCFPH